VVGHIPGTARLRLGWPEAEAIENAKEALALWFEPSELKLKKRKNVVRFVRMAGSSSWKRFVSVTCECVCHAGESDNSVVHSTVQFHPGWP
jgi:hypothetical protein